MNGLLNINKPLTWTSMDVIRKLRRITGIRKIGHAGTLDPLATGVLLVCIGKATKKINDLMTTKKEYIANIDLSAFSNTEDREGELTPVDVQKIPSLEDVQKVMLTFIGNIEQTPPLYSAIKIGGKPAYKWAREGKKVPISSRTVTIDSIDLLKYSYPMLQIKIQCGKGTYIRSLARDIGKKLNTGGYLTDLIRTQVGTYKLDTAIDIASIDSIPSEALIALD